MYAHLSVYHGWEFSDTDWIEDEFQSLQAEYLAQPGCKYIFYLSDFNVGGYFSIWDSKQTAMKGLADLEARYEANIQTWLGESPKDHRAWQIILCEPEDGTVPIMPAGTDTRKTANRKDIDVFGQEHVHEPDSSDKEQYYYAHLMLCYHTHVFERSAVSNLLLEGEKPRLKQQPGFLYACFLEQFACSGIFSLWRSKQEAELAFNNRNPVLDMQVQNATGSQPRRWTWTARIAPITSRFTRQQRLMEDL